MRVGTVAILMLAIKLRENVREGSRIITLEEAERRVKYWSKEVVKRVSLFSSDARGWDTDRRKTVRQFIQGE